MPKVKPIVARTPKALAEALDLPAAGAGVAGSERPRCPTERDRPEAEVYSRADRNAFRYIAHQSHGNSQRQFGTCFDGPFDPYTRLFGLQGTRLSGQIDGVANCGPINH